VYVHLLADDCVDAADSGGRCVGRGAPRGASECCETDVRSLL